MWSVVCAGVWWGVGAVCVWGVCGVCKVRGMQCVCGSPPTTQSRGTIHTSTTARVPPSREHIDPTPALLSNSPLLQALWNSLEALTSPRPPPSDLCPATWRLGWC